MTKEATIYARSGRFFVAADHQTEDGFWITAPDVAAVAADDTQGLGQALAGALASSRQNVPTPPPSADLTGPLLAAAGVASWNTFAKPAKCVVARMDDGEIKLTPQRNGGPREGFVPLRDKARTVADGAHDLGEQVIATFADAL